jgi:hypothetical protein
VRRCARVATRSTGMNRAYGRAAERALRFGEAVASEDIPAGFAQLRRAAVFAGDFESDQDLGVGSPRQARAQPIQDLGTKLGRADPRFPLGRQPYGHSIDSFTSAVLRSNLASGLNRPPTAVRDQRLAKPPRFPSACSCSLEAGLYV